MRWHPFGERAAPDPVPAEPATGRPLDPPVRQRMESRLGHDFGSVRVHEGDEASALHARAFAVGEDVTFAPGRFAPHTAEGEQLLAHELGHVVEHREGAAPGAYRAPEGEEIPAGQERPLQPPRAPTLLGGDLGLTLALGTLDAFAFNGSDLTDDHRTRITQIADFYVAMITKAPGAKLIVTGHTDLVGGEQANVDLGRRRAISVAAALVAAGIPSSSIEVVSAGESTPAVETETAEPRNRRVEVRYKGPATPPPGATGLTLGGEPPKKFDFTIRDPTLVPGPGVFPPPFTPKPSPTPQPQAGTPQGGPVNPFEEQRPRPGSPGDIAKAVAQTEVGKRLIEQAKEQAKKDLGKLSTGGKVVLGTVGGSIAAGVIAGIASDPGTRKSALDFIDGKEIPVPGLEGIAVVPHTKGGAIGGGVTFDLVKIFGGGK